MGAELGAAVTPQEIFEAIDGTGVYVVGDTEGALPGQIRVGGKDVFVIKLTSASASPRMRK